MNTAKVVNVFTRAFGTVKFQAKKYSPEFLMITGIGLLVGAGIGACVQSVKKTPKAIDISKSKLKAIKEQSEKKDPEGYTMEIAKKDTRNVYLQTGVRMLEIYGIPAACAITGTFCILASNNILKKRNAALAATLATVTKSFADYRERLIEKYGDEVDQELMYGITQKEITQKMKDENGEEKEVKSVVPVTDGHISPYAIVCNCSNVTGWTKDDIYNESFLRGIEFQMQQYLTINKYVFLNDVLEALGAPRTKAGQIVGWIWERDNKKGDNKIKFIIHHTYQQNELGEYEPVTILDFNVEGNIIDRAYKKGLI